MGACRPFENLVDAVVAIIDVSMRGAANRNRCDLFLDGVDSNSVSKKFFGAVNMHEAIGLSESLV